VKAMKSSVMILPAGTPIEVLVRTFERLASIAKPTKEQRAQKEMLNREITKRYRQWRKRSGR
jgi:hypothetical protein